MCVCMYIDDKMIIKWLYTVNNQQVIMYMKISRMCLNVKLSFLKHCILWYTYCPALSTIWPPLLMNCAWTESSHKARPPSPALSVIGSFCSAPVEVAWLAKPNKCFPWRSEHESMTPGDTAAIKAVWCNPWRARVDLSIMLRLQRITRSYLNRKRQVVN